MTIIIISLRFFLASKYHRIYNKQHENLKKHQKSIKAVKLQYAILIKRLNGAVYGTRFSRPRINSKTACRGFESFCPCHKKRYPPLGVYSKGQFFHRIWHSPFGLCLFPLFKRISAAFLAFLPLPQSVLLR